MTAQFPDQVQTLTINSG